MAAYWGRYTEHSGVCVCTHRKDFTDWSELMNPYGVTMTFQKNDLLKRLVNEADVIHCHDDVYPTRLSTSSRKILVYQAHIGDIPERMFRTKLFSYDPRVRHASITNGYGRLFKDESRSTGVKWGLLPDVIDIWNPVLVPRPELRPRTLRVAYTYSNTHEPGRKINAKGPKATKKLLANVTGVEVCMVTRWPFEHAMALKQSSQVVLDEVFSPFTHLSSLEGAAVGACVLVNFDDKTVAELCDFVGAPRNSYPFFKVTPQTVAETIMYFRDHVDEAIDRGKAARAWMERYYDPASLLQKYLHFYGVK